MNFWKPKYFPSEDAACCNYPADFGQAESDCCPCVEGGLEECSVIMCLSQVETTVKAPCDPVDPDSGQLIGITPVTGEVGQRFFSEDNSQLLRYTVTKNDNNGFDAEIEITGQAKGGPAALCWLENNTCQKVVKFFLDKCGDVVAVGLNGGLELTNFEYLSGQATSDFRGFSYTYTSDKRGDLCYVNWAAMGFASPADFFDFLLGV